MTTVLEKIVADKYIEVCLMKQEKPLNNFQRDVVPNDRDFYGALETAKPAYIFECKPKSPSKGVINPNFDLTKIVASYSPFATVISVLTDYKYFGGKFENLSIVHKLTDKPLLCKDFIIDEYQIYYARLLGASGILLMLSVLNDEQYLRLREVAHSLNMGVLTETSNESELERAIALDAKIIGINNRDLHTLTVSLETTKKLAPKIPEDRVVISESGIASHEDVLELLPYADGFLIGGHLMGSPNLDLALRELIFGTHKVCGLNSFASAKAAYDSGAYYGGLIFVEKSPRYISPEDAKALIEIPLNFVGVFQNDSIEKIISTAQELGLKAIQLHGDENFEYITELRAQLPENVEIFRALDASAIEMHQDIFTNEKIDCIVLDNKQGGTGESFDWSIISTLPKHRYLLAGGVGEENLTDALSQNVCGVDMNSALEITKGEKCAEKIQNAFKIIREYKRA